jgi:NADPH:quinone reductase-like Zn-dependent oxidoreductase
MKVMELRDDWGLDHLHLGERQRPEPGPGQVVVAVGAASLNYRDHVMMDQGYGRRSGELPLIPISDGAGEVAAVGEGVDRVAVGDLVCPSFSQHWISGPLKDEYWPGILGGPHDGVMQELMLLDQSGVVRAPKGWDALHAATLPCAAITAWSAVVGEGRIEAGQTVLIQGSGGVSVFALLFAKMHGARVIATTSGPEKAERLDELGADHVINYREDQRWGRTARDIAGGGGVDIVVEVGGAGTLDQSLRAVRGGGTLAMIGVVAGGSAALSLGQVVTRAIRLQGITVGNRDMLEAMITAIEQNPITPPIDDRIYAFDELPQALAALPEGKHFGKIAIRF